MDQTTSLSHDMIGQEIIDALSSHLPIDHTAILIEYLAEFTLQQKLLMKARLDTIPPEDFPILTTKFANVAVNKFRIYLEMAVAPPQSRYFPGRDASSNDIALTKTDGDGNSGMQRMDDAGRNSCRNTPAENANGIYGEEGDVDSEKIDQGDYECGEEEKDQPHRPRMSLALSLRDRLFGDNGLPQEIYDVLIEELFSALYLRGSVIPGDYVDSDGHALFADAELCLQKSGLFHDIDTEVYERYKKLYWSQNTWQIQCGEIGYALGWLNYLPDENYLQIRLVEMAFSTADSFLAQGYYYVYENDLNLLENLDKYDDEVRMTTRDLHDIWFWKLEAISGLRLDRLTLDFTGAFSVEDKFLGLQAAVHFHSFEYGMPELKIRAPTIELEVQLMAVFVAIN